MLELSKYRYVHLFLLLSIYFIAIIVNAQESKTTISNTSLAEKIYLQLDKDIYTTGSTIWFKSIVTKSLDNSPTDLSGILYVELINAEKTILEKKLIKLNHGIGDGHFDLTETLQSGTYLIRTYTEWNKNFDTDFFFEKYIQVFSIYDITTTKEGTSENELPSTEIHPEITSTINNDIDLQFLPESGELVNGLSSKVGFKALNSFGSGIPVEGTVFDNENNQVSTFKSNALGMGSFELDSVNGNKTYYAKLKNASKIHPLPKATLMGNVMSVVEKDKIITANISSNYLKTDSIYLNVSFRGTTLHELKAPLKNGNLKFLFSSNELPEGIIGFKMMDTNKKIVAERLYFNKRFTTDLNLKIATNKSNYSKREMTNLTLETTDGKGEFINANASILVIDKKELGEMQSLHDNILSYFLLNSELKGEIENPGYYFNENKNMLADLDALMLTQGWRHYKYSKVYETLSFNPETALTVSGTASNKSLNNKSNQVDLTMMTFGKEEILYTQTTDSLGRFNFDLDDEFGGSLNILIQSTKKAGKKVDYDFKIDEKKSPTIVFDPKKPSKKQDPIIEKEAKRARVMDDLYIPDGSVALDEVLLTGRNLNTAQQKVTNRFGEPDIIIDGKELKEKEKRWHSGIYDILHYNFPDKVRILRDSVGGLRIQAINNQLTLVVVDGIPVQLYEYSQLQNIPASEIISVEVIEYAKFFKTFCIKVYSPLGRESECSDPRKGPQGNIVAIYTKSQKGIHSAYSYKPKGLSQITIPVFSESKTFYAPKYDKSTQDDLEWPDLRTLIHWQPILKTNDSGKVEISFYNGDATGDMMVIVEAISDNGAISYQEYTYKVK